MSKQKWKPSYVRKMPIISISVKGLILNQCDEDEISCYDCILGKKHQWSNRISCLLSNIHCLLIALKLLDINRDD